MHCFWQNAYICHKSPHQARAFLFTSDKLKVILTFQMIITIIPAPPRTYPSLRLQPPPEWPGLPGVGFAWRDRLARPHPIDPGPLWSASSLIDVLNHSAKTKWQVHKSAVTSPPDPGKREIRWINAGWMLGQRRRPNVSEMFAVIHCIIVQQDPSRGQDISTYIVLMLGQRRRYWPIIKTILCQSIVSASLRHVPSTNGHILISIEPLLVHYWDKVAADNYSTDVALTMWVVISAWASSGIIRSHARL